MESRAESREAPTDPAPPVMGGIVPLADDPFVNDVGRIDNLKHGGVTGSVSVLYSKGGTHRASHYHKEDSHWLYVVSGGVYYYERAIGAKSEDGESPTCTVTPGQMLYTPPMREHILVFPVDTVMVSISDRVRTHEEHEADVVRVEW